MVAVLEYAVVVLLFALYLGSFSLASQINQAEVFAQDSLHILQSLASDDARYAWNPQNHILYHVLVDAGYALWRGAFGHGPESAFRFLKLFTAITGVGFLLCMRRLLAEIGLGAGPRAVMLVFTGVSVAAWFNFSGFETHGLALPFMAGFALAVVKICRGGGNSPGDRAFFAASLVLCVWARSELWALVAAAIALPWLIGDRKRWRQIGVDIAAVAVAGAMGTLWLTHSYLQLPLGETAELLLARNDRPSLDLQQAQNLRPHFLLQTGRAFAIYPILSPVARQPVPTTHPFISPDVAIPEQGVYPCHFCTPLRTSLSHPVSFVALAGVLALLAHSFLAGIRRIAAGDRLQLGVAISWLAGWIFYTWFNPREPFLWLGEFLLPIVITVANVHRTSSRRLWFAILALSGCVAAHNLIFFYWGPAS